jgi:hypothetical protein
VAFEGGAGFAPLLHVEFTFGGTPINRAPVVDAGVDASVTLPSSAALNGTVSDDGLPNPPSAVSTTWSVASGPGSVTFANPNAVDTTAGFSVNGSYVLRLTADDSALSTSDLVTITVLPQGTVTGIAIPIRAAGDDAEERYNGSVLTNSTDLDITTDGNRFMTAVGLRFTGLGIPRGASITNAYVQFRADEVGTGPANLTVRAQASDNAPTFTTTSANLSTRPTTAASVAWAPTDWNTVGAAGAAQQTSNLAAVIQEVVNRPGWVQGNAVALVITGTGDRTAESFEGSTDPVLHVEWHQ